MGQYPAAPCSPGPVGLLLKLLFRIELAKKMLGWYLRNVENRGQAFATVACRIAPGLPAPILVISCSSSWSRPWFLYLPKLEKKPKKYQHEESEIPSNFRIQARKRNPNPNFLVRISSVRVGVFRVNGWGPNSSVCGSKPSETKLLGGISQDFGGISRKRPKGLRKKIVFNSRT